MKILISIIISFSAWLILLFLCNCFVFLEVDFTIFDIFSWSAEGRAFLLSIGACCSVPICIYLPGGNS